MGKFVDEKHLNASSKMLFTNQLKRLREERGLTQKKLSEMAGVYRTYISDVETGRRIPSLTLLEKITKSLGLQLIVYIGCPIAMVDYSEEIV